MYPTIEQMPVSTAVFLANLNIDIDNKFSLLSGRIKAKIIRLKITLDSEFGDINCRTNAAFIEIKEKADIL